MLTAGCPRSGDRAVIWGLSGALAIAVGAGLAFEPVSTAVLTVGLVVMTWLVGVGWVGAGWRWALIGVLLGYLVLSRGFAYTSIDLSHLGGPGRVPVYIGEVALVASLLGMRHTFALPAFLRTPGGRWLFAWIALGLLQTASQIPTYGISALRDAAIWYYGLFAYVGFAFAERPRYVWTLLRVFALGFVLHLAYSVLHAFHIVDVGAISIAAPGSDFPLFSYRHDASAVNLLGGVLFAFLLGRHFGWPAWVRWLIAVPQFAVFLGLQVRAAYVGSLLACVVLLYLRQLGQLFRVSVAAVLLVIGVAVIGGEVQIAGQTAQTFSVQRLMDSVASMTDVGGSGRYSNSGAYVSVDNTRWRLDFWASIVSRNFESVHTTLLGLGFGPDLVSEGRFMVNEGRPNRNPHNIVVTVFGRMGLLGLLPWLVFNGLALAYVLRRVRAAGCDPLRRDAVGFTLVYAVAMLGAACFGVLLESPFMAIPYYFLLGVAMRMADPLGEPLGVWVASAAKPENTVAIAATGPGRAVVTPALAGRRS